MSTISVKNFSIVEYIQRLRKANFSEEQAEVLAKETEQIISNVLEQAHQEVEKKDLATKKDLETTKNQLILWIVTWNTGLLIASGLLQHFFK